MDVVLKLPKQAGWELPHQVELYFRNPAIRDFNLGPNFHRTFRDYAIYTQVFPQKGIPRFFLPYATIPQKYLPKPPTSPSESVDLTIHWHLSADWQAPVQVETDNEEKHGEEAPEVEDSGAESDAEKAWEKEMKDRLLRLSRQESQHGSTSGGSGTTPGRLSGLAHSLGPDLTSPQVLAFLNLQDDLRLKTGPDWENPSTYRGVRQPPLAARLDTICKFLADEDVDRCLGWEVRFPAVVAYLEWLASEDEDHQLLNASDETKALYLDAVNKAEAHILFEKHHYSPTSIVFTPRPTFPLRSSRLNTVVDGQVRRVPLSASVADQSALLPRPSIPRPDGPVVRMSNGTPAGQHAADRYFQDLKDWWAPLTFDDPFDKFPWTVPSSTPTSENKKSLAYIEDKVFRKYIRGDNIGWIRTDPDTGEITLPDGTAGLELATPQKWAQERGARRAGFQQAIRLLASKPPLEPNPPRRHLVFPIPAETLRKAFESADGVQWKPPSLDLKPFADRLEPMPWNIWYRDRFEIVKQRRHTAWLKTQADHENDWAWLDVPLNVITGGPFVWNKLDKRLNNISYQLRSYNATIRILEAAVAKVPRPLLEEVLNVAKRGINGEFDSGNWPPNVRLAEDEWDGTGVSRTPRLLWPWEVDWLKFLATESVNRKSWKGRFLPDTPKEKYHLFQLFARKVKKLLDDPNPIGLFAKHDAVITVEQLLDVINAKGGDGTVTKHQFHPYDANCWLDRMAKTGHVRFTLDLACYGVIQRPEVEFHPEHRVHWPNPEINKRTRPFYSPAYIHPWEDIIQHGAPDVGPGSQIWNFFVTLGYRLGRSISVLTKEWNAAMASALSSSSASSLYSRHSSSRRHGRGRPSSPVAGVDVRTEYLLTSLDAFNKTLASLPGEDAEPTREELDHARTAIIEELAENKTMLAPARRAIVYDRNGAPVEVLVRDMHWDWASLKARGETKRRQYWSVNRWPVGVGYLTERAERAVKEDQNLDPRMTYDATKTDPTTSWWYTRPKLKPYGIDKTEYRRGPAVFPIGDTRLQRELVKNTITFKVATGKCNPIQTYIHHMS
jgi:hypothetical protein